MMAPGELNRRLELREPVETPDGVGGVMRTYTFVAQLWAKVEPVSARRVFVADAAIAPITHRIIVRRRSALTTRHCLADGTTIYRIVTIRPDATRRFLVIGAEERAD
jgi:SPP1 family predicted phage head-tail adaptor